MQWSPFSKLQPQRPCPLQEKQAAVQKKFKTAKYCKSIADTFTMYSISFNLAGEMDIGYAANNMIIYSVTQPVPRIFDKKSLHHLVFALCFFT